MKKILIIVFILIMVMGFSVFVYAIDVPTPVKNAYNNCTESNKLLIYDNGNFALLYSNNSIKYNANNKLYPTSGGYLYFKSINISDGSLGTAVSYEAGYGILSATKYILASNNNVPNESTGSVFFSLKALLTPMEQALNQFMTGFLAQSLTVSTVGVVILSVLLAVSLIKRLIYCFF
jgi:hypothetical protein